MGRSTSSCFKIISCGCINNNRDQIHVSSENKGGHKPGWSLRQKSAASNAVVTEKIPSLESKEITEPITITSEPQIISKNISEKTSDNIWTEEIPNSVTKNATVSTTTKPACEEDIIKREPIPNESESESAVLVIQAAVRRFLAERQLVKHKNVVKLQAAVRGHLVRNHAVGTLRCVQAIVKMQALVRARREKGAQTAGIGSTPTHISIEKLLSNRLARQLLESTPKTKQINIKCDPSKSDSAWNWLERWMSVSSPETLESHTPDHDQDKAVNNTKNEGKMVICANNVGEAMVRFEEKENLINIEEYSNVKTHEEVPEEPISVSETESKPIPKNLVSETKPKPIPENLVSETKLKQIPESPVSETKPEPIPENSVSEAKPDPIPENPVSETEPKPIPKNLVSETEPKLIPGNLVSETELKQIPENPVSETKPGPIPENLVLETEPKPITENQVSEAKPDQIPENPVSETEPKPIPKNLVSETDNAFPDPLKSAKSSNQDDMEGSGSGLPADIGSSDPFKPDDEVVSCADMVTHGSLVVQNGDSECGTELSITSTLDSPNQFEIENKKLEEPKVSNEAVDQVDQKPDHIDQEPVIQVSVTPKKTKTDKKVSGQSQNRKSWSASKKSSPVRSSVDSGLRSSLEELPKDRKPVKRRNSFGSPKPGHIDHESSVPSYMQATESARAKAVANSSPRSSPDVHDKETYLKKRHSLPGAVNDRQGSPRIQRSIQTTKGNGNQERKWQI